ncbi:MAG: hypothetical protein ACMUHB_01235 [Thermoplasmatota archaeon]
MARVIGGEVRPGKRGCFGREIARYRTGTTTFDVVFYRIKIMVVALAFSMVLITLILAPTVALEPAYGFVLLLLIFPITVLLVAATVFITAAILIPMIEKILRENCTVLTGEGIHTHQLLWFNTGRAHNFIPYRLIRDLVPADDTYIHERGRETPLWYRILMLTSEPPPGGLYNHFASSRGLIIVYLKRPLKVERTGLNGKFRIWPVTEERWVEEVILDIDPKKHGEFMERVKVMAGSDARARFMQG